jgi:hypothetical protein
MATGVEQMALLFSETQVEMTLNSNFLARPETRTVLGHFRSRPTRLLKEHKVRLTHIADRLRKDLSALAKSPLGDNLPDPGHEVRYLLGNQPVAPDSPYVRELEEILRRAHVATTWTAVDGVLIQRLDAEKVLLRYLGKARDTRKGETTTAASLKCTPLAKDPSGNLHCPIPGFGGAYLPGLSTPRGAAKSPRQPRSRQ